MKWLAVLRHAKSSWDDPDLDDFDRPLNDRGWKAARRVGEEMKERNYRFDLVLASPAARARETIDAVREKFAFNAPIRFDQRLYLATEQTLLVALRQLSDAVQRTLLVGHNSGLERLILELTGDDRKGLRDRLARKFPTAAFALIELPANRWDEVEPGSGALVELILPKELD